MRDEFIKLAASSEMLGRAAIELHLIKPTQIGMDLPIEWDEVEAFAPQPDGLLFSWCERFQCYRHLIYKIVNNKQSLALTFDRKEFCWEAGESLLQRLKAEGTIKQVFPLHDERKRKQRIRSWSLKWWDFTEQPLDEIYSYCGPKIAIYFAFPGMHTKRMLFPATFGLTLQLIDFGLQICRPFGANPGDGLQNKGQSSFGPPVNLGKRLGIDKTKAKEAFQKDEWFGYLLRFRNDAFIILCIIGPQLPFELASAHLYEAIRPAFVKFGLTVVLWCICLLASISQRLEAKYKQSSFNMRRMKARNIGLTVSYTRCLVYISCSHILAFSTISFCTTILRRFVRF